MVKSLYPIVGQFYLTDWMHHGMVKLRWETLMILDRPDDRVITMIVPAHEADTTGVPL